MSEKPTLASVARAAGVSIPTVSQVMRGTGRISEETRTAVLEAVKKLHYVPNSRAAAMRSGDNREIGFLINQLSNPFNAEVISGAVDLLEAEGFLLSVLDTRDDAARQHRHLQSFVKHGRGGLLWVPAYSTSVETFDFLRAHKLPTVTFLRRLNSPFDHLGIRNADATQQATDHLLSLGHRHIAYFGGTLMTAVRRERIAGYERAMAAQGSAHPLIWPSENTKLAGLEAMQALTKAHPEVTALVCNGDMVALGASLALTRMGKTPGKEVSIVGFDDIPDAAVATPALTTLAVSPHHLGRKLGRILLDRIADPDAPPTVVEVNATLVIRETTAPPMTP